MKTYTIDGVTVTEEQLRKVIQENPELKEKQGRWRVPGERKTYRGGAKSFIKWYEKK